MYVGKNEGVFIVKTSIFKENKTFLIDRYRLLPENLHKLTNYFSFADNDAVISKTHRSKLSLIAVV